MGTSTVCLTAGEEEAVWSLVGITGVTIGGCVTDWPPWVVVTPGKPRPPLLPPLPGDELKMGTATDLSPILIGTTGEGTGND